MANIHLFKGNQTRFFKKTAEGYHVDYRTWMNEKHGWAPVNKRIVSDTRCNELVDQLIESGWNVSIK